MAAFRHASQGVTVRNFWLCKTRKDQEIVISGRGSRQITDKKNKNKVVAMEFVTKF